jgi:hypothetical protein
MSSRVARPVGRRAGPRAGERSLIQGWNTLPCRRFRPRTGGIYIASKFTFAQVNAFSTCSIHGLAGICRSTTTGRATTTFEVECLEVFDVELLGRDEFLLCF